LVLATAAVLAAVFFFLLASLPPLPLLIPIDKVDPGLRSRTVAAVYHIHTTRSDGAGTKEDVAAAAARAGAQVAIVTDHGDGTQSGSPPAYLHGVLCIEGVEISTNGGHYVALDMPASPYPLGGEPSAVVEDVRRLGGFGIAAHPDHATRELSWRDWRAPIDGLEWLNADAEWRDEGKWALARVLFAYFVRPAAALASVFDRPSLTLDRWDSLEKTRPVVALAAADAHGGARSRQGAEKATFGIGPSYESSFRSLSNRVVLDRPLTGEAVADARLVMDAVRGGRLYSVVDAIASGVVLSLSDTGFAVVSPLPEGAQTFVRTAGERRRIEVHAARAPGTPPVPWVVSNWAGLAPVPPVDPDPGGSDGQSITLPLVSEWRVEKDPESSGRVSGAGDVISLEYRLRSGAAASQFAAAAADLRDTAPIRSLAFRGRATKPMRVSVQLRFAPDDGRWMTSVYLDGEERDVVVPIEEMAPAGGGASRVPQVATARSILFVVDLVNARPGETGSFTISGLRGILPASPARSPAAQR
jgi:hypothetical protein